MGVLEICGDEETKAEVGGVTKGGTRERNGLVKGQTEKETYTTDLSGVCKSAAILMDGSGYSISKTVSGGFIGNIYADNIPITTLCGRRETLNKYGLFEASIFQTVEKLFFGRGVRIEFWPFF